MNQPLETTTVSDPVITSPPQLASLHRPRLGPPKCRSLVSSSRHRALIKPTPSVNDGIMTHNNLLMSTTDAIKETCDVPHLDCAFLVDTNSDDDEMDVRSRSIIKRKTKMQNMYPVWNHYNVRYNFYNYKKFAKTHTIPIQYKTPTVFLDGLYFALPRSQILTIRKNSGRNRFVLSVSIPKTGQINSDKMTSVFHQLDRFNCEFFQKNEYRFNIGHRYTQKASSLDDGSNNNTYTTDSRLNNRQCFTPVLSEDEYAAPEQGPIHLKENPLRKKMRYISFYNETLDSFIMTMEIKPMYMGHIINSVIKQHMDSGAEETIIIRKLKQVLAKIKSEHFDFRTSSIDMDIGMDLNLTLLLWIKCSLFTGNELTNEIAMKWKICNYEL